MRIFAAAAALSVSFSALAQSDWDATFRSRALEVYLDASVGPVIVIGVGEPQADAQGAAASLAAALRARPGAHVGELTAMFHPAPTATDAQIVSRANAQAYDLVAVVRVSSQGGARGATVNVYAPDGKLRATFASAAGVPVDAPPPPAASDAAKLAAADAEYLRRFVQLEDGSIATSSGLREVTHIYQGGVEIKGEDVYLALQRPDLADQYRTANITKWSLVGGGLLVGLAGDVYRQLLPCYQSGGHDYCTQVDPVPYWSGVGVLAAGVGVAVFALIWNPHPLVGEQVRVLARDYNERLKRELGLAAETSSPAPQAVRVGGSVGPGYAGLTVSGEF